MRLWTVPAVLAALLSAAAAQACFFKCCSRPAAGAAPADYRPGYTGAPYLNITSVDTYPVDMAATPNVRGDVHYNQDVDVVVYADYATGSDSDHIDLVLTELGPRAAAAVARKPGDKKHHPVKRKVLVSIDTGSDASRSDRTIIRFWELHFTLPAGELVKGTRYRLQAFYPYPSDTPTVQSEEVTFWTIP
jgi:hypothetical protein